MCGSIESPVHVSRTLVLGKCGYGSPTSSSSLAESSQNSSDLLTYSRYIIISYGRSWIISGWRRLSRAVIEFEIEKISNPKRKREMSRHGRQEFVTATKGLMCIVTAIEVDLIGCLFNWISE